MEPDMGRDTQAFFEQISPEALEKVCQEAEASLNEVDEEEEPPLSPIVGYSISDDDSGGDSGDESSEPDPETDAVLAQLNERLAEMTGAKFNPEAFTPSSERRKRLRKRRRNRTIKLQKLEAEAKRQKLMENSEDDDAIITDVNLVSAEESVNLVSAEESVNLVLAEESVNLVSADESVNLVSADESVNLVSADESVNLVSAEEHVNLVSAEESQPFVGFRTASGKPVNISEEALKNAKTLFSDIDIKMESETKDTFKRPFNKLGSGPSNSNIRKREGFRGFQTASGKPVTISDEAMKKATILFNEIDKNPPTDLISGSSKENNTPGLRSSIIPNKNVSSGGAGGGFLLEKQSNLNAGEMTQEVLDCIQALLQDEESSGDMM